MNVLVTGGAGFIGSHVAETLLNAGHRVVVVDNLHTGNRANIPTGATFYEADILDRASLDTLFTNEQIEAISHQAALANVRESMSDPLEYARVNLMGSLTLLELARKYHLRKIVFASTGGAVYGEGASPDNSLLPFTEESKAQPKDNYGTNKLSVEYHLDLYYKNYNLPYVALRYPNVYGPRQNSKGEAGVIAIFTDAMLNNQQTRITGDGEQTRDFAYVGDIARANLLALTSDKVGIYNVGTGVPTSINTVHDYLTEITHYNQTPTYIERPVGEVLSTYLNSSKSERDLGWQAQVSLEEGLRRTVEWFRSQR
jgi:UDP-glucose 4-epimerase